MFDFTIDSKGVMEVFIEKVGNADIAFLDEMIGSASLLKTKIVIIDAWNYYSHY